MQSKKTNKFYKVYDDIISKADSDRMVKEIYNPEFPFYIQMETSEYPSKLRNSVIANKNTYDTHGLVHVVHDTDRGINSFLHETFSNIVEKFCKEHDLEFEKHIRMKINLVFQKKGFKDKYHYPHIDTPERHYVLLYYINDSDGPTWLFNNKYDGENHSDTLETAIKIEPKQGRAVLFDGRYFHASTNPAKHDYRAVINFNFTTKKEIDFSIL